MFIVLPFSNIAINILISFKLMKLTVYLRGSDTRQRIAKRRGFNLNLVKNAVCKVVKLVHALISTGLI